MTAPSHKNVPINGLVAWDDTNNKWVALKTNSSGELEISIVDSSTIKYNNILVVKSTDEDVFYLGKAVPGTATSAASWQIMEITYDDNDGVITKLADGNDNFDNIFDNRESLSYS